MAVGTHSWTALGTHDTARIRTVVGNPDRVEVAAGLLATLPGVPMLFAGDESASPRSGEEARRTMPWHDEPSWHRPTLARYRSLLGLRRAHPALRHGGMRLEYADADTIAFWRETAGERLLAVARRASGAPLHIAGLSSAANIYGGAAEVPTDGLDVPGVVGRWQLMATWIDRQ